MAFSQSIKYCVQQQPYWVSVFNCGLHAFIRIHYKQETDLNCANVRVSVCVCVLLDEKYPRPQWRSQVYCQVENFPNNPLLVPISLHTFLNKNTLNSKKYGYAFCTVYNNRTLWIWTKKNNTKYDRFVYLYKFDFNFIWFVPSIQTVHSIKEEDRMKDGKNVWNWYQIKWYNLVNRLHFRSLKMEYFTKVKIMTLTIQL